MFGLNKKRESAVVSEENVEVVSEPVHGVDRTKKGPTPRRSEQEAQRQRPLVGGNRAQSKEAERKRRADEQARIREGMKTGDERFLLPRDRGPQKRYARNFVDARTSLGESLLIVVLIFLVISFIMPTAFGPQASTWLVLVMWVFLGVVIIDGVIATRILKRRLVEKFGTSERGVLWYAFMRILQLRPMRQPKPQVKRGEYPR